jgi:hypothetical protein
VRLLSGLALLAAVVGCVPKDFTYVDCAGAGGGCETSSSSGAGSVGGAGGSTLCGDGTTQTELGEECDLGAENDDDQLVESSIGELTPGAIGCTRSCKNTVEWTRVDVVSDQSVFTGVVVVPSGVVAGGFSLGGDTSVILNRSDVAYSAVRRIQGFDPSGMPLYSVTKNDAGKSNGVIGMAPAIDGTVYYLETYHEAGVSRGAFVQRRDEATVLATTPDQTSAEYYTTAIGAKGDGSGAYVLAYDPGGMILREVDANGSVNDLSLGSGAMLDGDSFGAITGVGANIAAAWGDRIVRLDGLGNSLSSTQYANTELTGLCVRPDGVTVAVGWYQDSGDYDPIIVWIQASGAEVGKTIITDSSDVDGANAVACAPDGSIVVVGEEGLAGETDGLTPRSRAWARKYGPDRALLWTRKHESYVVGTNQASDTDARAVAIDAQGFVYVAGREMTSQDTASGWLRKYAP